jgi:hypothetical protein
MFPNLNTKDFELLFYRLLACFLFNFQLFNFCWLFLLLLPFGGFFFIGNLKREKERSTKIQKNGRQQSQPFPHIELSVTLLHYSYSPTSPHSSIPSIPAVIPTLPFSHQCSLCPSLRSLLHIPKVSSLMSSSSLN